MSIAMGCDEAGYELKQIILRLLSELGQEYEDYGSYSLDPVDYPEIGQAVAEAIAAGKHDRGILICGTGIGMAIAANKVAGVRAAQCHDVYSAERARKSNNAQVMTMGARVIGPELAKMIVKAWLDSDFSGGNSTRKVQKITEIEQKWTTQRS